MNSIRNYEELLEERWRVEARIAARKIAIGEELLDVRKKFEPFLYLLPVLTTLKDMRTNNMFVKVLTSLGIDLVGQKLLSKTNWLTRLIIPLILKRFSRHTLDKV